MPDVPRSRLPHSRPFLMGLALLIFGCGPMLAVVIAQKLGHTGEWRVNPIALSILASIAAIPCAVLIVGGILEVFRDNRRDGSE
jgi:hypothetical protein